MAIGRKVLVFRLELIRLSVRDGMGFKKMSNFNSRKYKPFKFSEILPYELHSEEGVARWLLENHGEGTYAVRNWLPKHSDATKVHLRAFITLQVFRIGLYGVGYNVFFKKGIANTKAWRNCLKKIELGKVKEELNSDEF